MMNLHLLRIFETVAVSHSFSQAAEALSISQPAVSKSMREFERQLGVALVDRTRRAIRLTEAGKVLHHYAQQLFATERAAEAALAQINGLGYGQLALGASSPIGTYILPAFLGLFRRTYPDVRIRLDIASPQELRERLHTEPLDSLFIEGPIDDPELTVVPWCSDSLVVIVSPTHPLIARQPVSLDAVLDTPFVLPEYGTGIREVLETALQERRMTLRVAMEMESIEAVKHAVCAGLGAAIVSASSIDLEHRTGTLVVLDVPELLIQHTLVQVWAKGPASRTAEAFRKLLTVVRPSSRFILPVVVPDEQRMWSRGA